MTVSLQNLAGINADTTKAVDLFGSKTGVATDVLKQAMESKRLAFNYRPMSDELSRSQIKVASEFLARNGLLTKPLDFALLRTEIDTRLGQAA